MKSLGTIHWQRKQRNALLRLVHLRQFVKQVLHECLLLFLTNCFKCRHVDKEAVNLGLVEHPQVLVVRVVAYECACVLTHLCSVSLLAQRFGEPLHVYARFPAVLLRERAVNCVVAQLYAFFVWHTEVAEVTTNLLEVE